jgi:transaldolase/glucose-6-phosphate isomerase
LSDGLNGQAIALPPALQGKLDAARDAWLARGNTRRLWAKDAALWIGGDESDWLGWLDIIDREQRDAVALREFGRALRDEDFRDVLLLGMGGSSLGPEVLAKSLQSAPGYPKVHVLDSTDPEQVRRFENNVDLAHTLFIVASKSGTTLEPNVLMDHFLAGAAALLGSAAASHFVAITDPGSRLQETAEAKNFRRVFLGVPSVGGRYSVLSKFGLVPLAATGHDPHAFLAAALVMTQACRLETAENPGVALGLTIGVLAASGRDKLTLIASPSIASFGAWVEQLVAESTGKNGCAVIPTADEPLCDPAVYGTDRLFVYLRDSAHPDLAQDLALRALEHAGQPVVRIALAGPMSLAQEFFRFELATAVAGAVLGINPFDQPDVEASKTATRQMTEAYETTGALPTPPPVFRADGIALYADADNALELQRRGAASTLESWFKAHAARLVGGDYFAILAYLDASEARVKMLQALRANIRDRKRIATCLQFGPRFLHSTGQAHKGGPNTGVFLQVTAQPAADVTIPGRKASFGVIEAAQAAGDFRVLAERGRRILHAHIDHNVDAGIAAIARAIKLGLE